jgi:hypothetical protein
MKNIHLWLVLLISLSASKSGCSSPDNVPVVPAATPKQSIYCPELDCWSLKDCLLHNSRSIFLDYVRNKKLIKKREHDRPVLHESVLPMLPQELRYLIGSYAESTPSLEPEYKITGCIPNERLDLVNPRAYHGTLAVSSDNTSMTLKKRGTLSLDTFSIAVTNEESQFFRDQFKKLPSARQVRYEYGYGHQFTEEFIFVEISNGEDIGVLKPYDIVQLKSTNSDWAIKVALKQAGLLPKKKKN